MLGLGLGLGLGPHRVLAGFTIGIWLGLVRARVGVLGLELGID